MSQNNKKYNDIELQHMSVEELQRLKDTLIGSDRWADDSGTTPTQQQTFTLPDGRTIPTQQPSFESVVDLSKETYFVKLKDEPLAVKYKLLKLNNMLMGDRTRQLQTHKDILVTKLKDIDNSITNKEIIKSIHYKSINGLIIENPQYQELEHLRTNPLVESVILQAEPTLLMDTVINQINATDVHNAVDLPMGYTGNGVKIGIIDSGITPDGHLMFPDGKIVDQYDFINNDSVANDVIGHGTHVASLAAGVFDGQFGGVATGADLYIYKVCHYDCTWSATINAIEKSMDLNGDCGEFDASDFDSEWFELPDECFEDHLDVINLSLGALGRPDENVGALACDAAVDIGVVVVAAAGNAGTHELHPFLKNDSLCDFWDYDEVGQPIYDWSLYEPTGIGGGNTNDYDIDMLHNGWLPANAPDNLYGDPWWGDDGHGYSLMNMPGLCAHQSGLHNASPRSGYSDLAYLHGFRYNTLPHYLSAYPFDVAGNMTYGLQSSILDPSSFYPNDQTGWSSIGTDDDVKAMTLGSLNDYNYYTGLYFPEFVPSTADSHMQPFSHWTASSLDYWWDVWGYSYSVICPACSEKVIAVGSVVKDNWISTPEIKAYYSSTGPAWPTQEQELQGLPGNSKPDIVAPGSGICGACTYTDVNCEDQIGSPFGDFYYYSEACESADHIPFTGTSMASPIVVGAVALLIETMVSQGLEYTPQQVKDILKTNARWPSHDYSSASAYCTEEMAPIFLCNPGDPMYGDTFFPWYHSSVHEEFQGYPLPVPNFWLPDSTHYWIDEAGNTTDIPSEHTPYGENEVGSGIIDIHSAILSLFDGGLPGDVNNDDVVNVLDVVTLVNLILSQVYTGEELAQEYPQADMNNDGSVNVLDVVTLVNLILNNPTTSSRDRQKLQKQLDRLGSRNNQQTEKQLLIDSIMNKTNSKSEKQRLVNDVKNKLRRLKNDQ